MSNRLLIPGLVVALIAVAGVLAGGCAERDADAGALVELRLAPAADLPAEVREAPDAVTRAYRFAVANPDILSQVPCYCGCGSMGHTSNAACYLVDPERPREGGIETHALGCSICVDITLDVMRLMRNGRGLAEINAMIDSTYSRYGPSNRP